MKRWTGPKIFTYLILLFLLITDYSQAVSVLIYDNWLSSSIKDVYADQLRFWIVTLYWSILIGIPLVALVIKLNQGQLWKLNMDKSYIITFMIAGLILLLSLPYNCFMIVALIYAIRILFDQKTMFGVTNNDTPRMILLFVGISLGLMVCLISFIDIAETTALFTEQSLRHFLLEIIPISIYEEAVYRGMLYMFLADLGLSESKSLYIQSFFFWSKHINYALVSPFSFWLILPILSLTLGYIAIRSKSLTPNTVVHILYNAFAEFIVF